MVRDLEFDVCEMAPTTYMIARALRRSLHGAADLRDAALPPRRIRLPRPIRGISMPKDLEGKKVGVRAYSVTTGVWTRGILVNEYGLDSSKVTWVVDDEEHVTSAEAAAQRGARAGGQVARRHDGERRDLRPASPGTPASAAPGPPTGAWEQAPNLPPRPIPSCSRMRHEVEADWFKRTGIYPIHGSIVVKDRGAGEAPVASRGRSSTPSCAAKAHYMDAAHSGRGRLRRRQEVSRPDADRRRSAALRHRRPTAPASRR